jgi:hypothetical protein
MLQVRHPGDVEKGVGEGVEEGVEQLGTRWEPAFPAAPVTRIMDVLVRAGLLGFVPARGTR